MSGNKHLRAFHLLRHCGHRNLTRQRKVLRMFVLAAISDALLTLGCATPHATLGFTAPSSVVAGTPFSITVKVSYEGEPDTVINSSIHFTSSDPNAVLPGDYYFTPSDAGSHTWLNAFVLTTPGSQTVSGAVPLATGIDGSAQIKVSP